MKAFLILLLAIVSQAPPSPKGIWEGTVALPGQELAFSATFIQTGNTWAGTFDIPAQGAKDIPVGMLTVAGVSVSFVIPGPGQPTIQLTESADGKTMSGTLMQGGASFPVKLAWKGDAKPAAEPEIVDGSKLEGIWQGSVPVGGQQIRLIVRFAKSASGSMNGFFSSPDQGPGEIPISGIGFKNSVLQFIIPAIGGNFSGTMSADGTTISGTITQGISQPLVLKKTERVAALNRPQEPKRPFPYQEEEVQYSNAAAGIRMAGTLTRPQGQAPFAAAILITGSGAQDRDETILGHKPFLLLSDHLTRNGMAVLRIDDRGVGGSTGNFATATTADFAGDAMAAIQFLKSRKEIDARHIGLIGHSEGGAVAPIVASQSSDVAFIVMLAGPGLPGEDILYAQAALIAKTSGASDAEIAAQRAVQQSYYAVLKSGEDSQTQERKLRALGNPEPAAIMSQWFRYFLTYDPRPALAKTKCPVLALIGAKDLQVPARENLTAIESALKSGGNKESKAVEIPNLNHLFQTSSTGLPGEYGTIEETMSPVALNLISSWISQQH